MEKIVPFVMAFAFLLLMYLLLRLCLKITDASMHRRILSYGTASEESAYALFSSAFGKKNVIENATLPVYTPTGALYTEIDDIIVLSNCIVSVEIKSMVGTVYNKDPKTWHQSVVLSSGRTKELDFVNPFLQNERHTEAIREALRDMLFVPPVYGLVIFTSDRVSFTHPDPRIHRLPKAMELLQRKDAGDEKMSEQMRGKIADTLRRASRKGAFGFARQNRNRQNGR